MGRGSERMVAGHRDRGIGIRREKGGGGGRGEGEIKGLRLQDSVICTFIGVMIHRYRIPFGVFCRNGWNLAFAVIVYT